MFCPFLLLHFFLRCLFRPFCIFKCACSYVLSTAPTLSVLFVSSLFPVLSALSVLSGLYNSLFLPALPALSVL